MLSLHNGVGIGIGTSTKGTKSEESPRNSINLAISSSRQSTTSAGDLSRESSKNGEAKHFPILIQDNDDDDYEIKHCSAVFSIAYRYLAFSVSLLFVLC